MQYQDQTLPCDACGGEFTFSAKEQAFFAEKGFSAPRRCQGARKAKKATGRTERYDACPFDAPAGRAGSRPAARPAPRTPLVGTGVYRSGQVVKVMTDRGFGFLRGEDEQDYFFDQTAVEDGLFLQVQPGTHVTFEAVHAARGPRAQHIVLK